MPQPWEHTQSTHPSFVMCLSPFVFTAAEMRQLSEYSTVQAQTDIHGQHRQK